MKSRRNRSLIVLMIARVEWRELSEGWHGNLLTVHFRELSDCPPESTASSVNNSEFLEEEVGYLSCGAKIPVISAEDSVLVRKACVFLLNHCRSCCSKERTRRLNMRSIYPSRSDPDVTYDAIKRFLPREKHRPTHPSIMVRSRGQS